MRNFVDKELIPIEQEVAQKGVPQEILDKMKKLGYYGITIPKEYGGEGLGLLAYVVVLEELSRTHPAFSLEVQLNNGLGKGPIYYYGTEEQKNTTFPSLPRESLPVPSA